MTERVTVSVALVKDYEFEYDEEAIEEIIEQEKHPRDVAVPEAIESAIEELEAYPFSHATVEEIEEVDPDA